MMPGLIDGFDTFDRCKVAVIGDLMLDEYLWGHMERISPEAPVPILNVNRHASTLRGAGNVVENLRALGVQVAAFGVVGGDETGEKLRALLTAYRDDVRGVVTDSERQSTRKVRMMSLEHGQQVFRLDQECTTDVRKEIEDGLLDLLRTVLGSVQVVLISDYRKGVLTERLLKRVFGAARERAVPCIVAPKDSKAEKYRGVTVLVPNARELGQLVGTSVDGDGWLNHSAKQLMDSLHLQALVVTRGSQGLSLFEHREGALCRVDVATSARSVYDVTGAGDTAIAVLSASLATGSSLETAVRLANLAAGIKVGKRGTATVSMAELIDSMALDPPGEIRPQTDAPPFAPRRVGYCSQSEAGRTEHSRKCDAGPLA
jgi:D-beta-D-heptose 7-phosphate kinase/D-beta-D-heptose 1-phosphate adenosyltransferase